jgi:hypothetical protein
VVEVDAEAAAVELAAGLLFSNTLAFLFTTRSSC